ncbi:sensor domain-containing diguanylate cyclase [Roseateles sp. LKC17W]|uniref:diguanylate cyclase n=1 Tax=Pelomonas margarita TaxID=3299031 RepID=A0ABW7FE71_9BURK
MSAAPLPATPATLAFDAQAQQNAFVQCVMGLQRTLRTTPLGWALVAWICWGRTPPAALLTWLGLAAAGWAASMLVLARLQRAGPDVQHHGRWLLGVAIADGAWWGAVMPLLSGADTALNAILAAVLCGAMAVNAPAYVPHIHVFHALCAAMWLVALLSLPGHPAPGMTDIVMGLGVFLGLLCYVMRGIARRVVEGLRLQLANAALTAQLSEALAAASQQAATDGLTGLPNRRSLDQLLDTQLALAQREGRPFSVLMLDLDHFKAVNDTHGHAVGDAVLRGFAQRIQTQLRRSDVCARYGGEEFCVVLPGTAAALALDAGERLRRAVAAAPLSADIRVTVSVGVATWQAGDDAAALLARADDALYTAKRTGRDRVVAAPPG